MSQNGKGILEFSAIRMSIERDRYHWPQKASQDVG